MNRLKNIFATAALFLAAVAATAQTTPRQSYLDRYEMLVSKLGVAGVGVETLLNRWESDYPDDTDMLLGKFYYYLSKSHSTDVQVMDAKKYLGEAPLFTLKDSLKNDVNYFQVSQFDDELFGKSIAALDKAIELKPLRLEYRIVKIATLIAYEKEFPDMALMNLKGLVDFNASNHPEWELPENEAGDEFFVSNIQDLAGTLFRMGTPATYEAFREISEKMNGYYPNDPSFMTNLGSYYLVVKNDDKTALKYYNKALKKRPDDYPTIKNCVLLARNSKNVKLEKKFLPILIRITPDEMEKASAEARLSAL